MTAEPSVFSTGLDSPVIIASLTELWPERTTPSAGAPAPGRSKTTSPSWRSEMSTSWISSPRTRYAVRGSNLASSFNAPRAWAARCGRRACRALRVPRACHRQHRAPVCRREGHPGTMVALHGVPTVRVGRPGHLTRTVYQLRVCWVSGLHRRLGGACRSFVGRYRRQAGCGREWRSPCADPVG